jgi:hypothetical protein
VPRVEDCLASEAEESRSVLPGLEILALECQVKAALGTGLCKKTRQAKLGKWLPFGRVKTTQGRPFREVASCAAKVPSPLPNKIETVLSAWFPRPVTYSMASGVPSPFRSTKAAWKTSKRATESSQAATVMERWARRTSGADLT